MSKINQQKTMLELALQISNELGFSVFPCREKTQGNKKAKSPTPTVGIKTPAAMKSRSGRGGAIFQMQWLAFQQEEIMASLLSISTLAQIRTVKPRSMNSG